MAYVSWECVSNRPIRTLYGHREQLGRRNDGWPCSDPQFIWTKEEELSPQQCILPGSILETWRSYDAGSLLLRNRIPGTYPFAVPKIRAWYILKDDFFVMDHYSSLWRQRQKPSTSTLRETKRQEGTAMPFQSPNQNILQRVTYSLTKGNGCFKPQTWGSVAQHA